MLPPTLQLPPPHPLFPRGRQHQLSPFAQILTNLQQLQQSDPAKYSQVAQQIGTNLQAAAQQAQSSGDTTAANQLNQLATDFTSASKTGQLPNTQDLAKAIGGHHHHGHSHAASSDSDSDSSVSTDSSSSTSSTTGSTTSQLNQLFAAFQTNSSQSQSTDPLSIILSTLQNAGVTTANS